MGASQTIINSSLTVRFLASMFAFLLTNNCIIFLSFAFFAANKTAVLNSYMQWGNHRLCVTDSCCM